MFQGHPKGLYVAFFANMGERFGFYTMMAILVLFLQAKYNLDAADAGWIYSTFYTSIYGLALLGGFIADRTQKYKGTITAGIVMMFFGYILMAVPGMGLPFAILGLATIAFGNGLFKGNLQALVGQMYDDPKYSKLRDTAFSIFYMGINVGAFFAPNAARAVRSWYLESNGFGYDADLPNLCNQMIEGSLTDTSILQTLANKVSGVTVTDLAAFSKEYIEIFSTGYNYAFGVAAVAMLVSLVIYFLFKRHLPDKRFQATNDDGTEVAAMPKEEVKQRMIALGLVFAVVIFFWMSFHQNGLTMTMFARDYIVKEVDAWSNLLFNVWAAAGLIVAIFGVSALVKPSSSTKQRGVGALVAAAGFIIAYLVFGNFGENNPIEPETFQHFNPAFIVILTPIILGVFAWMRKQGKEPSSSRKIGIGMIIASLGFVVMIFSSLDLMSPADLAGAPSPDRVSPFWLIDAYLVLTVAELFLSPIGISFVSKVSPPQYQGLMQGGWLGATALGNQLLVVGSLMWGVIALWQLWSIFAVLCLLSAAFMFSIMKRLEKVERAS